MTFSSIAQQTKSISQLPHLAVHLQLYQYSVLQQTENTSDPNMNQHDVYTIQDVIATNALRQHICKL